jgi:hypothetical protein
MSLDYFGGLRVTSSLPSELRQAISKIMLILTQVPRIAQHLSSISVLTTPRFEEPHISIALFAPSDFLLRVTTSISFHYPQSRPKRNVHLGHCPSPKWLSLAVVMSFFCLLEERPSKGGISSCNSSHCFGADHIHELLMEARLTTCRSLRGLIYISAGRVDGRIQSHIQAPPRL